MTDQQHHGRRGAWLPAAAVFAVALAVRLAHFFAARHAIVLQPRGAMDEYFFHEMGMMIARSGDIFASGNTDLSMWPREVPFFLPPLYIYFLGLIYAVFGEGNSAPFLIQSLLGALAAAVVCRTAQMIAGEDGRAGRAAGLVAGLLLGLDGLAVMYSSTYLAASLDPLLAAVFFFWVVKANGHDSGMGTACCAPTIPAADSGMGTACCAPTIPAADSGMGAAGRAPTRWALAGAALGLFVLNRPNALLLLPFAASLPFLRRPLSINRRAITLAAALSVAALVVIAPAAIRNAIVSHRFVLISSHGGLNFYIGNWSGANGAYSAPEWLSPNVMGQIFGAREWLSEEKLHRPVSDAEVSGLLYRMALSEMANDPGRWLRLAAAKFRLLLAGREAGLNLSLGYMREAFSPALRTAPFGMWLLLPLGIAGAVMCRKRREALVVAGLAAVFGFSVWMFFVTDRYRLPLHPPLAVLAGCGVAKFFAFLKNWREKKDGINRRELAIYLCTLAAAGVIAALPLTVPSGDGQMRLEHALRLVESGRIAEAEKVAAGMPPGAMNPYFWRLELARAYRVKKATTAAEAEYRRLLAIDPSQKAVACELAALLTQEGRQEEAKQLCGR